MRIVPILLTIFVMMPTGYAEDLLDKFNYDEHIDWVLAGHKFGLFCWQATEISQNTDDTFRTYKWFLFCNGAEFKWYVGSTSDREKLDKTFAALLERHGLKLENCRELRPTQIGRTSNTCRIERVLKNN